MDIIIIMKYLYRNLFIATLILLTFALIGLYHCKIKTVKEAEFIRRNHFINDGKLCPNCRNMSIHFGTNKDNWNAPHLLFEANNKKTIAQKNIFFLKLHKTASSTIQNIFMRYADNNNLNIALPVGVNNNLLGYPRTFSTDFIQKSSNEINIMCHHLLFNGNVSKVIPKDTKFITIIRHPDTQFLSSYDYFHLEKCYSHLRIQHIEDFVRNVTSKGFKGQQCTTKGIFVSPKNGMLFDFGVPHDRMNNNTFIKNKIMEINARFDLVMLSEYIDESLVLMRDILGWRTEEIIYFTKIQNIKSRKPISTKTRNSLREWNNGDMQLYKYFNTSFWKRVNIYGYDRLKTEVGKFRQMKTKWENICIKDIVPGDKVEDPELKVGHKDEDVLAYKLREEAKDIQLCKQLAMQEKPYTAKLKQKMFTLGNT
ncbi:unnamed protein product [Owenia fusiformis]|uniref:Uncharacterized protein n=1 Tax=Owenia fusiformis TaxID=6347 RepID=A0A8J1TPF0_OWEFU|nr:unnamed protein product [Owenia fusiformis]